MENESFRGFNTSDFVSHVSTVPFVWEYFGRAIPMGLVAGVLGVDQCDGYLAPRLGFGAYECRQ